MLTLQQQARHSTTRRAGHLPVHHRRRSASRRHRDDRAIRAQRQRCAPLPGQARRRRSRRREHGVGEGSGSTEARVHRRPSADGRWDVTCPYGRLSVLLSEMIHSVVGPVEAGARASRHHPVESSAGRAVEGITAAMARMGFDPKVRHRRGRTEVVLRNCPFESAALTDPDTVCSLHLGIAPGLAEEPNCRWKI
jgi:hypothetical protein